MLNEKDIDKLKALIDVDGTASVYYLASRVERRESYIDEVAYKSDPAIDIVKLQIGNITNALWEVLNYNQFPSEYHTESELVIIDHDNSYQYYYTVPNAVAIDSGKPFNARMPSAIYGCRRVRYKGTQIIGDYHDPSPVQTSFTNTISFGTLEPSLVLEMYQNGRLDWKYRNAPENTVVDGIPFKYMTSNWYILEIDNFPRTEHHLINTKQKNAFFIDVDDALSWRQEMQ